MAKLDRVEGQNVVLPETDDERSLVLHGKQAGGWLVLLDGYYAISDEAVVLPTKASRGTKERVRVAFEQAALHHREAQRYRQSFRLIKGNV